MNKKLLLVPVMLALAAAGGKAGPVRLTAAANGSTNSVAIGSEIEITLSGNPTTGYSWEVVSFSTNVINQIGTAQYLRDDSDSDGMPRVGVGGRFIFRFKTVGPGQGRINLTYRRPWEKTADDQAYFVVITVGKE